MSSSSSRTSASSQEDVKEEAKASTSSTSIIDPKLSLHDYLSLGEVELGLSSENVPDEEIQRLPFFLRVLSLTRPLSSIGILGDKEKEGGDDRDPVVNQVVARLEHVVATYSVAEGVDVVTCHLAPSMSRKLSKLSPLQKLNEVWNTQALTAVAKHPTTSRSKRRRSSVGQPISATNAAEYAEDGIQGSSDEGSEEDVDEEEEATPTLEDITSKKRKLSTLQRRDSLGEGGHAEDSQEATVTKTLSELASLVASSLEPLRKDVDDSQEGGSKGQLSLTIDDSILSERGTDEGVGGAMAGSDLGSTVAAIMHHAPVLRSRHVAVCTLSTEIKLINSHAWLALPLQGWISSDAFFVFLCHCRTPSAGQPFPRQVSS
jgi:hypothetical protein